MVHNHPYSSSPFPSATDFVSYLKYGVHYGIVTNDLGTFLIKNNSVNENKKKYENVGEEIGNIKVDIISDFKKKFGYKYNDNNKNHVVTISTMVNENQDKYLIKYQEVLSNYNIEAIFI